MSQWYLSYNGQQTGPMELAQAQAQARRNPDGFAWREGFPEWVPIARVAELSQPAAPTSAPPAPSAQARPQSAHEVDYEIFGSEMQFVEVELDPGESVVAEAGAMMYKNQHIEMETIFGDGSAQQTGFLGKLAGAGKRLITGESLFMTVFTHKGSGKARVAFASPYPGNIIPVSLPSVGGTLICQKDCFLCAARGVSISIAFQKRILTGLFGGEGFIMQKLEGDGMAFVHAGGTVVERTLNAGEHLHVDTGCLVALEQSVTYDIRGAGGIKSALFGGEGLFLADLAGPGRVWLQSLPFSRLAGRMLQAAPKGGGKRTGEGSILGGLGDLIGGDN